MPAISRVPATAARAAIVLALLAPILAPRSCAAQGVDSRLWGVNGTVDALAHIGNTLFIGGGFSTVGPCTGGGVPVDRVSGAPLAPYPRVNGRVSAVVSDDAGGWFLGGHFTAVEGLPRLNLAHVLADGSVAPWSPSIVGVDGFVDVGNLERRAAGVSALALKGNVLYVGGRFTEACGQTRNNLAAIDAITGTLLSWDPNASDEVRCLAVHGRTVYVGGEFTRIGGLERHYIAALGTNSAVPTAWDPNSESRVRTLVVDGRTLFAGGDFVAIGGQPRNAVAALDVVTGRAMPWDAHLGPQRQSLPMYNWIWPYVSALAVRAHTLYVSGDFDSAGGQPRPYMAAFDTHTGGLTEFAPHASSWATTLVPFGNLIYAGGDWYDLGGIAIPHVAALDATTGHPTTWNPRANGLVEALAVDQEKVFVGGSFTSLRDWQLRNGLAALDLVTGRATSWDPQIDGYSVRQIAALGDTLFIAGVFKGVGGETRGNVAAVDARTGAVTSWNPGAFLPGGPVIRTHAGFVELAGYASGTQRFFSRVDPVTAAPEPFDARLDGPPDDFIEANGTLYLAGNFVHVGGEFQPYVAAIDAATAQLRPWNPEANPSDLVFGGFTVLASRGNTIYMGGSFSGPPWFPRTNLAAVDGTTGALLPWDPHPTGSDFWNNGTRVLVLKVRGDEVWVGGDFNMIGGLPRTDLAVLDATTGAPLPLSLEPDNVVAALEMSGDTVFVGGAFQGLGGIPHGGVAEIIIPHTNSLSATAQSSRMNSIPLWLGPCRPNPVRARGVIAFSLPREAHVSLAVFDLRGRRVATILDREPQTAGAHEAPVNVSAWKAGVYFCRIEASGAVATRKLLVVN